MSRAKTRNVIETCADCGAVDPSWASINRGLLICDECCSIHRSLGRHVSQVKSLRKGAWNAAQLAMVNALHSSGANSVWEHALLDPSGTKGTRKKPTPKDPAYPTKAEFIRAKHQNLAFVYRPSKDDGPVIEDDVNKQLHSSVRTGNLETSLRFLSIGADPNFMHPEKGNTPLHVAAKSGQSSQAELLFVYGADPAAPDADGLTPVDYARDASYTDLADRLTECQYELTDRLAFYLCGRKPDHRSGQHYVIPEMADSLDQSELAVAAKKKLQSLPNNLLEVLAMDIYDEVDRRETDAIWLSTQNQSALVADRQTVPFLPVNPEFPSTRNQGRQKLARFNAREFAALIIDVLNEIRQRQLGLVPGITAMVQTEKISKNIPPSANVKSKEANVASAASDDEPLYDSVASDEDYADSHQILPQEEAVPHSKTPTVVTKLQSSVTIKQQNELRRKLSVSEMKVHQLQQRNKDMKHELILLQNMVQKLLQENTYLRSLVQCKTSDVHSGTNPLPNGYEASGSHLLSVPSESSAIQELPPSRCSPRASQRPQSMYEPRERLTHLSHSPSSTYQSSSFCSHGAPFPRDDSGIGQTHSSHSSRGSGDYDNSSLNVSRNSSCIQSRSSSVSFPSESVPELPPLPPTKNENYPSQEEVIKKTEQITKKIQELLISAQEGKHQSFIPCSEKVYRAVLEMASIFPQNPKEEDSVQGALKQLTVSAFRLQAECQTLLCDHQHPIDYRFVTQQVMQCAYDIAKAAKQLVTLFQ